VKTAVAIAALALGGCMLLPGANDHSGTDRSRKGARPIALEPAGSFKLEGEARDVVTRRGGDGTDWKRFEVPAGKSGRVDVTVKYTTPRQGLDLKVDLYDARGKRKAHARRVSQKAKLAKARVEGGAWYVRIYAPGRDDAANYKVTVTFSEDLPPPPPPPTGPKRPPPPPPPPPPPVKPTLTPDQFKMCLMVLDKCERDKATCEAANKTLLDSAPKPVRGGIWMPRKDQTSGLVILTVNRGTQDGVARGWDGQVLRPDGTPLPGGSFKVITVNGQSCVGKVQLPLDVIRNNPDVLLSPPAGSTPQPTACKECVPCPY
jgi:hypothetical protein